jgi:lysophospholipase L1-like esterase
MKNEIKNETEFTTQTQNSPQQNRLKKWILNIAAVMFGFILICGILGVLEIFSQRQLKIQGPVAFKKLYHPASESVSNRQLTGMVGVRNQLIMLDPLLGYGRSIKHTDLDILKNSMPFLFVDNFAIYLYQSETKENVDAIKQEEKESITPELLSALQRPIIVTLGGSTTDAFILPDSGSWPEELARLMVKQCVNGTIINGGMGGFSTAQEMLKLLRDVLEIKPDIVISYSGVNECFWPMEEHPIHHIFQQKTFDYFTVQGKPYANAIFPNLTYYLRQQFQIPKQTMEINYGIKVNKCYRVRMLQNITLMKTICEHNNIEYHSILQPFVGSSEMTKSTENLAYYCNTDKMSQKRYANQINLYKDLFEHQTEWSDFMEDFTEIFDSFEIHDIYPWRYDAVHVSRYGNSIIAKNVFERIFSQSTVISKTKNEKNTDRFEKNK